MGCDIHCHIERRQGTSKAWSHVADGPVVDDRSYNLFSILADVRNGRGFAGVRTGEGFVPIAAPRGLPSDVSPEIQKDADEWGEDGHSHSHLTIAEIMAYDWSQKTTLTGIVSLPQLARWRLRGSPESWSGGIGGPGIQIFSQEQGVAAVDKAIAILKEADPQTRASWYTLYHLQGVDQLGAVLQPREGEEGSLLSQIRLLLRCQRPHFQVSWEKSYWECAGELLRRVVPLSWALGRPEDVRLVFWFDN